uniref:Saposin A-type domain-containing protein n=1 Tax=Gossypium raimondii TaxID=29730 RepID=A0A0D2TN50_GOSRA|nr:hypothetical protein B456_012G118200 [Gossypium raimondii]
MGYLQQFIFFILVALPFMFISPTHSSLANGKVNILPPTNTSDKVTLALYYETLCPYCADFITNDLVKVFLSDLFTIVNLKLVPWGNADILGDEPHCQHGEDECYLNTIHSCVIYYWPDVKKHFDFIRCTEQQSSKKPLVKNRAAMWKQCSEKLGMSAHRINKCYTSGYGLKLLLQYANETAKLKPPHEYVPWVVVDNQPLKDLIKVTINQKHAKHKRPMSAQPMIRWQTEYIQDAMLVKLQTWDRTLKEARTCALSITAASQFTNYM